MLGNPALTYFLVLQRLYEHILVNSGAEVLRLKQIANTLQHEGVAEKVKFAMPLTTREQHTEVTSTLAQNFLVKRIDRRNMQVAKVMYYGALFFALDSEKVNSLAISLHEVLLVAIPCRHQEHLLCFLGGQD